MQLGNEGNDTSNVEDRRGFGGGGMKLGLGGMLILGVLSLVFRQNLFTAVEQAPASQEQQTGPAVEQRKAAEQGLQKVAVGAFNDTQHFWQGQLGQRWTDAKLVLFWDQIDSGCGGASASMGPFYCPQDSRVYIDLGFYQELAKRFGAPGDFAQAYVIAHEVGHHVQHLLGAAQPRDNASSVRLELQADCYAGVWGHDAARRKLLDPGDTDEGLRAAASVGDDRIQKMSGRRVNPESFTHGSAEQRAAAFRQGLQGGTADSCASYN